MSEENIVEKNVEQMQIKEDDCTLDIMELEIYRNAWAEINSALSEIKALRGKDSAESDPVQIVKNEINNLKKNFAELKDIIENMQKTAENIQQAQVQPQQQIPTMQPTIPLMPYFSTPSYQPIIQIPH